MIPGSGTLLRSAARCEVEPGACISLRTKIDVERPEELYTRRPIEGGSPVRNIAIHRAAAACADRHAGDARRHATGRRCANTGLRQPYLAHPGRTSGKPRPGPRANSRWIFVGGNIERTGPVRWGEVRGLRAL